jgi:hypothetical protein
MESSLRLLKIIRIGLLAGIVLMAAISELAGPAPRRIASIFLYAILILATWAVFVLFAVRKRIVQPQAAALAARPDDVAALRRWRAGQIITYAVCEALAMYGIVLRFAGASLVQALPFLITGFFLMLCFPPKLPSPGPTG